MRHVCLPKLWNMGRAMEQSFWGFNITPLACNPSISTITTTSQQCPWGFTWVVGAWWVCDCQRVTRQQFPHKIITYWLINGIDTFKEFNIPLIEYNVFILGTTTTSWNIHERVHKGFVCPACDLVRNLSVQKDIWNEEQMLVLLKTDRKGLKWWKWNVSDLLQKVNGVKRGEERHNSCKTK